MQTSAKMGLFIAPNKATMGPPCATLLVMPNEKAITAASIEPITFAGITDTGS